MGKEKTIKLFVYGTLKSGGHFFYNGSLEANRIAIDKECTIKGKLYDLGWFPTIELTDNEEDVVHGEVHTFKNPGLVLKVMDQIEGYNGDDKNSLFARCTTTVQLKNGDTLKNIYVYELVNKMPGDNKQITTGVWEVNNG